MRERWRVRWRDDDGMPVQAMRALDRAEETLRTVAAGACDQEEQP